MPTVAPPTINLPAFEGPLDLLLHLIREQKLDIAEIPIALVTDQYLAIIAQAEERRLLIAGEFFVMAATLLEIKTRMLLPKPPIIAEDADGMEGIDPGALLAEQLERVRAIQIAGADAAKSGAGAGALLFAQCRGCRRTLRRARAVWSSLAANITESISSECWSGLPKQSRK